ncbi:MAG: alpha/beta hydrolase [Eubacteriales bacterium]
MSKTKYPIHPDFKKWEKTNPRLNKVMLSVMQKMLGYLILREKSSEKLIVSKETIPLEDGRTIQALLYAPVGLGENAPCLVYYHGGGFVFPAAPHHFILAREYALRTACKVLFVDYRLAPKYPFPAAPEDCFAAYCWVLANAKKLSIDAARVATGGDSAGGELATVVCLMARDRGQAMPCAQMLLYPVTGRGMETESMKKYIDTPMCNSRDVEKYIKFYIQNPASGKLEYASPIHAGSLEGLPPAYIETAEFDCLRDGGILYAERLRESGVPVELYNTEGTMHGFDVVTDSPIVRACVDKRILFLQKIFRKTRV